MVLWSRLTGFGYQQYQWLGFDALRITIAHSWQLRHWSNFDLFNHFVPILDMAKLVSLGTAKGFSERDLQVDTSEYQDLEAAERKLKLCEVRLRRSKEMRQVFRRRASRCLKGFHPACDEKETERSLSKEVKESSKERDCFASGSLQVELADAELAFERLQSLVRRSLDAQSRQATAALPRENR